MTPNKNNQAEKDYVNEVRLENVILKNNNEERKCSDERYAIKLAEKIVFGLVGLILLTVIGAIIRLVMR